MSSDRPAAHDLKVPPVPDPRAIDERIEELRALVTFLHADVERDRNALARKLHDELSGSVIAAIMDISWIEQHESPLTTGTATRLTRVKESLRECIDLARKLVEELRPTLLDSIGLLAALSWQFRRGCARAGLRYTEKYPEIAPDLDTAQLIGVFRVLQDAFNIVLQHESVTAVHLAVDSTGDTFSFELSDDGTPRASDSPMVPPALSSILHRARNVGADIVIPVRKAGGSLLRVSIPLGQPVGCSAT